MKKVGVGVVDTSMFSNSHSAVGRQVTEISTDPCVERLFKNEKKHKVERTADDALLSTLPSETLKFIKARRHKNSFEKVPLTYYRERQLRSVFRGLDFDGMGTIHLDLVKDAADYAEEKLKPKKGEPVFVNIRAMFEAMDEDGDGTVDFHEFTIAMTGSSSSTIDKASEHDVERLTARFLEFANIKKRERALSMIADSSPRPEVWDNKVPTTEELCYREAKLSPTAKSMVGKYPALELSTAPYDAHKLDSFRACFSVFNKNVKLEEVIAEAQEKLGTKKTAAAAVTEEMKQDKTDIKVEIDFAREATKTQDLIDWQHAEIKGFRSGKPRNSGLDDEKYEEEFDKISDKQKKARFQQAENCQKNFDVVEGKRRERAEQKYISSVDRKVVTTVSDRARIRKPPPLIPNDPCPVKNALRMQVQARKEIAELKEAMRESGRRESDTSSSIKTLSTIGSSGGGRNRK